MDPFQVLSQPLATPAPRRGAAFRRLLFAGSFALAAAGSPTQAQAQGAGDLLVAPTRVVLEGRQRAAELLLLNTGAKTATYRISFVQVRMDEKGGTKEILAPGPGELFADELIRYSPRQIVLEPNGSQTVRLQLRKPAGLPAGEYRSHLLFRAVPAAAPAGQAPEPSVGQPKGVSITLTPIYGVSIPIIVRHGETAASVTLSDLELLPPSVADPAPVLRLRMNRTGNQSVYGDFVVTFLPARGTPVVVGLVKGVAVYTPNPVRVVGVALHPPQQTVLRGGVLRVTYTKHDKGDETLAAAEIHIP